MGLQPVVLPWGGPAAPVIRLPRSAPATALATSYTQIPGAVASPPSASASSKPSVGPAFSSWKHQAIVTGASRTIFTAGPLPSTDEHLALPAGSGGATPACAPPPPLDSGGHPPAPAPERQPPLPALRLGKDVRLSGGSLSGAALWPAKPYIHICVFGVDGNTSETGFPSRVSLPSHRRPYRTARRLGSHRSEMAK